MSPEALSPERRRQLLAFLARLGLEPDPAIDASSASPASATSTTSGRSGGGIEGITGKIAAIGAEQAITGLAGEAMGLEHRLALVDEALTHTSACLPRNHERLEFLGDAVLRLAAASFLQRQHPGLSVGRCSALRAQLVSDRWLAELAVRLDLEAVIRLGAMASGDRAGRATVRAECCEALVGAVYEGWGATEGGLRAVQSWLDPHWCRDSAVLLADPLRHNWKSALQEWSQGQGRGLPRYTCQERSRAHGDPRRFQCQVRVEAMPARSETAASGETSPRSGTGARSGSQDGWQGPVEAEGWGGSRREAEQQAAQAALAALGIRSPATEG